ncbi:MAG: glycosyl hydrolase [Burkholderiales bacterium]|nr:glycosyl hydrolase [Burkholderiales bacterium]
MLWATLGSGLAATGPAQAGAEPPPAAWHDLLDTPATRSPLAARSLLNGLARAGERIVAVGQRGHVLWSDDAGRQWQQAQVPASADLVAVSFPDAHNGWAVGHDGLVLTSRDGGRTWARQLDGRALGPLVAAYYERQDPATLGIDAARAAALRDEARRLAAQGAENPWLDVWFEDARRGFVVGAFGLILHTTDGGASWQPWLHALDNPRGLHLYAMRSIGGELYITGEQGLVLKLDRAAGRFRALMLPYKGTLFGIVGNERALVVHGLRGSVLRSTDAGRSWATVPTGLQVGLSASTQDARGRLLLASPAGHLLASSDDGASFTPVRGERAPPAAAVLAAGPKTLLVAGPRGAQALALP